MRLKTPFWLAQASLVAGATVWLGLAAGPASAFVLQLSDGTFGPDGLVPTFGDVRELELEIDLVDPLTPGLEVGNDLVVEVRYLVAGSLSLDPPTPSGFPAFRLDRRSTGEGAIPVLSWIEQGSTVAFTVDPSAELGDGLQLDELVPGPDGLLFALDAREFERLDVARFHPPQILLFEDGTGLLRNSNNSSGSTDTTNPGTGGPVDVDFGEEYVTELVFDPSEITLVVPEPATGMAMGVALVASGLLARRRARRARHGLPARGAGDDFLAALRNG
jgi:hypothetical protein